MLRAAAGLAPVGLAVSLAVSPTPLVAAPVSLPIVVSVGVNRSFDARLEPLSYAETDAERFVATMTSVGGVASQDAALLRGATVEEFVETVQLMTRSRKRDSADVRLVLYFSGHADDRGLHFRGGPLPRERLHALLKEVDVPTRIVVLDSCFSGWVAAKGVEAAPAFDVPKLDVDELTGTVFLTASSSRENAYESQELSGSIFTHHLLAGLNGAADAGNDGLVTIDELYQYVYRETRLRSMTYPGPATQRPEYHAELRGQGALVMSRTNRSTGVLKVDPGIMGTVHLASMTGLGSYTVHGGGPDFTVREGAYRALIRRGDLVGETAIMIARGETSVLRPQAFAWRQLDIQVAEVSKGDSLLATSTLNMAAVRRADGATTVSGFDVEIGKEVLSMVATQTRVSTLLLGRLFKEEGEVAGRDFASMGFSGGYALLFGSPGVPARSLLGFSIDREYQYWEVPDENETVELNGSHTAYRGAYTPTAFAGVLLPITSGRSHFSLALRGVVKWQQDHTKDIHVLNQYLVGLVVE